MLNRQALFKQMELDAVSCEASVGGNVWKVGMAACTGVLNRQALFKQMERNAVRWAEVWAVTCGRAEWLPEARVRRGDQAGAAGADGA